MIISKHTGMRIGGICTAVPKYREDLNGYRNTFGSEVVDKFSAMTGVEARHISSDGQNASDLCYAAAKQLLSCKDIDTQTIGAVIFVSQTPDYRLPSTACVLSQRIGCGIDCMAFDVNLGCSGYVYGLNVVLSLMESSNIERGLLLAGDTITRHTAGNDKGTGMLFGDAGSATLIEKTGNSHDEILGTFRTDGSGYRAIMLEGEGRGWKQEGIKEDGAWLHMNGEDVFAFTVTQVPRLIKEYLEYSGKTAEDYDALVLHQANALIMKQISKKTKFSMECVPITIDRYGNTSVASIPLTICDRFVRTGDSHRVLLCGFGVGLSWGVVDMRVDGADILPILETDEAHREEGADHD